jgi:hypothetical protein
MSSTGDTNLGAAPQCLRWRFSEPHEATDPLLHFFACVKVDEREFFFNELGERDPQAQSEIRRHIGRVLWLRTTLSADKDQRWMVYNLEDSIDKWKGNKIVVDQRLRSRTWSWTRPESNIVEHPVKSAKFDWTSLGTAVVEGEFEPHAFIHEYARSHRPGAPVGEVFKDKKRISQLLDESLPSSSKWPRAPENDNFRWIHFPYNDVEVRPSSHLAPHRGQGANRLGVD